ncbi:MAG: creatininase family protein [Nitrososphaeria archaeon]|nr:creatininase family protein [Nitrososphaeria archaeon]NIQ33702.1 creatininase family protein [Nitrososphaeria archaeon]
MKYNLQHMSWEEVEELRDKSGGVAIVPAGSTEQHGRHLPCGTDAFSAIGIANELGKRVGALVTPPLWFGWSPHHMAYPGTITLRPEILVEVIVDICKSLVHHGFKRIVVINGHRVANLPPLQQGVWRAKTETGANIMLVDPHYMGYTIAKELNIVPIGHAGEFETSHIMYLHPDLVKPEKIVKYDPPADKFHVIDVREPGDRVTWVPSIPPTGERYEKLREVSGGVHGDPTNASKEKGKKIHEAVVNNIAELIEMIRRE